MQRVNSGAVKKRGMAHARRLRCGAARDPHPHRNLTGVTIRAPLFVHGHVHAIRDDAKERARRALHRKHVPTTTVARLRGTTRHLEQGKRVTAVRAQRTTRREVHVVPLSTPPRAADHICKCGIAIAVSLVGICAPALEGLCECACASCGRSGG